MMLQLSRNTLTVGVLAALFLSPAFIFADGPQDNIPTKVRAVPPLGMELKPDDKFELESGLAKLDAAIAELAKRKDSRTQELLPDIEIFARAVRHGVQYRELFSPKDVDNAKKVLQEGLNRADSLKARQAPWTTQKGLVVRGFRSKIDRTVQPYGLVIPDSYTGEGNANYRLDIWLHGRGENVSESVFIAERMTQVGRIQPKDTIVLHPYGRYSNAFKFAGEVDVLEALEHAQQNYRVDEDRIAIRGFSMGGAGCWQFAVHYPDLFFAANPGAGFSETKEFLRTFQGETLKPEPWEVKLWQMYDCPPVCENLRNLPTVAYSGELDSQKQAAEIMEAALAERGMHLTHIIGPQTKHDIHRDSLKTIEEKLSQIAKVDPSQFPREAHVRTSTLKYNRSHWVTVTALGEHWQMASVLARCNLEQNSLELQTENVAGIHLEIPAGQSPFSSGAPPRIVIQDRSSGEGNQVFRNVPPPETDRSWSVELVREGERWRIAGEEPAPIVLAKTHNLQGPIDDAFMDAFIVVKPTGKARCQLVDQWTNAEFEHFVREWRRQFRGDVVVKNDTEITAEDIAGGNLICFGDPASNKIIASIIEKLPVKWTAEEVVIGDKKFGSAEHAPILIYPNPLNPKKYVVLNSGFTYREYAYLNNARQVPKLPDWAIVDLRTPPDSLWPGKIAAADFFDEKWQVK